jgi:general secretion pathway protein E
MAKPSTNNNKMNLGEFLRMLVNAGKVEKDHAEKLYKDRKLDSSNLHPIIIIGEQKWKDAQPRLFSH